MKNTIWRLASLAAFTALTVCSGAIRAHGAEDRATPAEKGGPPTRQMAPQQDPGMRPLGGQMERLEQRLNQLAERQEQFMRQMGGQRERMGAMAQGGPGNVNQPLPPPQWIRRPMRPEGALPTATPMKAVGDLLGLLVIGYIVCNILMAVWIFTDIRKRGEGPAIFVAMALVAGIPAALIYALVRLGDKKASSP
jgi:hypothetical protein